LIAAADAALYYGKRSGENRVVRADRLPRDLGDLRGTLDELASAALRDGDDEHAVEHLVERASQMGGGTHDARGLPDALLAITRSLGGSDAARRGHADRVARLALAVASSLGMTGEQQRTVELAGRLHVLDRRGIRELGKHPSLADTADLILARERLADEGTRRRRRSARPHGPQGAHVLGVADAYDALVAGVGRERVGRNDAIAALRSDTASWDTAVIDALTAVVNQRRDPGRRRRGSDAAGMEDLGAA
ncbi:MAG TPA: hypothetical protein VLS46_09595, partial [Gaiellaceae bacterium]|nr:hypothetical protein [Gaiellaceae bacterium]